MNTLLMSSVLSMGLLANEGGERPKEEDFSWILAEMKANELVLPDEVVPSDKIVVLDQEGNVVSEYPQEAYIQNELSLSEYTTIIESDLMFEYQGDTYYLKN